MFAEWQERDPITENEASKRLALGNGCTKLVDLAEQLVVTSRINVAKEMSKTRCGPVAAFTTTTDFRQWKWFDANSGTVTITPRTVVQESGLSMILITNTPWLRQELGFGFLG